jgi:hypothetical protein
MCDAPRNGLEELASADDGQQQATSSSSELNTHNQQNPVPQRTDEGDWTCLICTVINTPAHVNCEVCESFHPGSNPSDWDVPSPEELYHPGYLLLDEKFVFWMDWGEEEMGEIDTADNRSNVPEGFYWDCCGAEGTFSLGCTTKDCYGDEYAEYDDDDDHDELMEEGNNNVGHPTLK